MPFPKTDIQIADNIVIGANAVVGRSFTKPNICIAGAPDKKISDKGRFEIEEQNRLKLKSINNNV